MSYKKRLEKLEALTRVNDEPPEELVIVQVSTREEAVASLELGEAIRHGTVEIDWDAVPMQQSKPGREFALACDVFAAAKRN
jgi:hypothetical protein